MYDLKCQQLKADDVDPALEAFAYTSVVMLAVCTALAVGAGTGLVAEVMINRLYKQLKHELAAASCVDAKVESYNRLTDFDLYRRDMRSALSHSAENLRQLDVIVSPMVPAGRYSTARHWLRIGVEQVPPVMLVCLFAVLCAT